MARPVTIFTGPWADLPMEEMCRTAKEMGYEGLEIASWGQIDVEKAAEDLNYVKELKGRLEEYGLGCWAIGMHLPGQCVGDAETWAYDPRLDNFAPSALAGKPEEIRAWGIKPMECAAKAARNMGVQVVTFFMGSPIWKMWYSFPQTSQEQVDAGYQRIKELWSPIMDVYDQCGVKLALEVHPTEIAFDYYSTQKLLATFDRRPTLGINFDPSHLVWQGMDPCLFLRDFADRIYHVHMKDVKVRLDGRAGILGSHIEFGDLRRGWNFVSLGHGDVDFDGIIRELNAMGYQGPLSVEWEDSGMERMFGAKEAYAFTRRTDFAPSDVAFDSALKTD